MVIFRVFCKSKMIDVNLIDAFMNIVTKSVIYLDIFFMSVDHK